MTASYRSVEIRPLELMSRGWDLIRDQYWMFLLLTFLAYIIGTAVPLNLLLGPMLCGLYYTYFRRMRGEPVEVGDLFRGFDWLVDSLIVSLVIFAISLMIGVITAILLLFGTAGIATLGEQAAALSIIPIMMIVLVVMLLSVLIVVPFAFAYPLINDKGYSASEAMRISLEAVRVNLIGVVVLVLVITLIHFFAMIMCILPIFFVMPITFGSVAVLYRDVFPETE